MHKQEYAEVTASPPAGMKVSLVDEANVHSWSIVMDGPAESPYAVSLLIFLYQWKINASTGTLERGIGREMTASTAVAPGGSAKRHPLHLFPLQGTDLE
jgi:hypothetical protein